MFNRFKTLLICLSCLSINTFGQKSQVLIARNAVGKLQVAIVDKLEAKKQLTAITDGLKATDLAEKDDKTKNWPEVWAIKAYLTSYASLIDTDPNSSDRYFSLASDALNQAKVLDKYESNGNLIQASNHNLLIKKQERGTQLFFDNNFLEAINDLRELSNHFKKDSTLALNTAICALNIQNYDEAITYFKRAKENGIKNPAVYQKLSQLYIAKYDNENALKNLEEGLSLNPYNKSITNELINILLDIENYTRATQLIENNLKLEKGSKLLYFLYGYLEQSKGNNQTAILAYNNALNIDQNYFDSLYQIALAYIDNANLALKKDDADKLNTYKSLINLAQFSLVKANEINPNDKKTVKLLIDIYTQKNALDKVQELKRRLKEF